MRTRKEIEEQVKKPDCYDINREEIMIELLLDIRNLLIDGATK